MSHIINLQSRKTLFTENIFAPAASFNLTAFWVEFISSQSKIGRLLSSRRCLSRFWRYDIVISHQAFWPTARWSQGIQNSSQGVIFMIMALDDDDDYVDGVFWNAAVLTRLCSRIMATQNIFSAASTLYYISQLLDFFFFLFSSL